MVKDKTLIILKDVIKSIDLDENEIANILIESKHIHLFDDVVDFRQVNKISYDLADILMMAFLVILEKGKQSFYYISKYIEYNLKRFEDYGLIKDHKVPSHDTFRRVFSLLDSTSFIETTIMRLYNFLKELEVNNRGLSCLGVDGKYVNGTGRSKDTDNPKRNVNVLNIYDANLNTCMHSIVIDDKTNEIPTAQEVLGMMDLKNNLVTADALHCQAKTTEIIIKKKGHYLLTVRDNQELLYQDIESKFNNPKNSKKINKTIDNNRVIEILKLPSNFEYEDFAKIRTYIKMTSHKRKEECIRYYISDLIKEDEIILGINERWCIENDLHKLKDDYLNEDSFRCIDNNAINNMVIMNNLISQLIHIYQPFSGYDLYMTKIALSSKPLEEIGKLLAIMSSKEIKDKLIKAMNERYKKNK